MKIETFKFTEWIFWFTETQKSKVEKLYSLHQDEVKTWFLFSIVLPFLTYSFSIIANLILMPFCKFTNNWSSILNNGSLPIIAFGIISAGVPYLMEKIEERAEKKVDDKDTTKQSDDYHTIRKRIMAIATLFLFLTSGLFIFQSILPNIAESPSGLSNLLSLFLSLIFAWFCASIGVKMYLLQSSFIIDDFAENMNKKRKEYNSHDDEYTA